MESRVRLRGKEGRTNSQSRQSRDRSGTLWVQGKDFTIVTATTIYSHLKV